jgi:cell wall-associated NlpC family hydrolase
MWAGSMVNRCARLLGAIALGAWSAACASTGAVPAPFPGATRPPRTAPPAPASPTGPVDAYALVGTALDLRGVRYRNGGADPSGFDCSGFTQYVFAQHGVRLPRAVRDQFAAGDSVGADDLREGDLVFFTTDAPGASHVGIAVGGDAFVHAPSSTGVVRVERLSTRYWAQRFVGVRRVTPEP